MVCVGHDVMYSVHVCKFTRRPQVDDPCLSSSLFILSLRWGLSLNLELTDVGSADRPVSSRAAPASASPALSFMASFLHGYWS